MTTPIMKRTARRTVDPYDHHGARLVAAFEPGDILSIREERRRFTVSESIGAVYSWMLKRNAERSRIEKAKARKKSGGRP